MRYRNSATIASTPKRGRQVISTNVSLESTYAVNKKCPDAIMSVAQMSNIATFCLLNSVKLRILNKSGSSAITESR